jgi:hypothetical protein
MKTIQEQLAERIYEILPHKKELEFGCKVILNNNLQKTVFATYDDKNRVKLCDYEPLEYTYRIKEIIGQPLRLADLLVATGFENFGNSPDITEKEEVLWDIMNMYNLSQDNILSQSDDFCEWALQILK